jgi:hypothetical protein
VVKTRTWVIVILAALLLSGGAAIWLHGRSAAGTVANLYVDGVCIRSIDLSALTEPETFVVEDEWGRNVVQAEPGRICVSEADCPDQVCVHAGWLTDSAAPIVCLPHKLVIQLEKAAQASQNEVDAVSQ